MNDQLVSALKRLYKTVLLSPKQDLEESRLAGFLSGNIPEDLLTQELRDAGHNSLLLTGDDIPRYYQTFDLLRGDPSLEYLTDKELKDQLWRLECNIFINRQEYKKNLSEFNNSLKGFISDLIKPLTEHEVLITIENFNVGKYDIDLGDCKLHHFTKEELLEWGFRCHEAWQSSMEDFADKTAIVLKETGNNIQLIAERARSKADLRLHALRLAFSARGFTPDKQLRFKLSSHTAIRQAGEPIIRMCQHVSAGPWDFGYNEERDRRYLDYATSVLSNSVDFTKYFKERISRAIYWLGRAVKESDPDQKVTLLCTAMESLLSDKSEVRKGERISYRMVLLEALTGNSFVHPADLLWVYNLRSSVVHGSSVGVATNAEYRTMLHAARSTLKNYVDFIAKNNFKKYSDLIKHIEMSKEALQLSEWLASHNDYKEVQELKEILDNAIASFEN